MTWLTPGRFLIAAASAILLVWLYAHEVRISHHDEYDIENINAISDLRLKVTALESQNNVQDTVAKQESKSWRTSARLGHLSAEKLKGEKYVPVYKNLEFEFRGTKTTEVKYLGKIDDNAEATWEVTLPLDAFDALVLLPSWDEVRFIEGDGKVSTTFVQGSTFPITRGEALAHKEKKWQVKVK